MGMSRCYSLMKGLLILFNIVFLCIGSAACGVCAWAAWEGESPEARAGLCAVAAWGAALAIAALAALCGAVRHSASLLAAAFALLALTAVAEAAAAWWGAAHLPQLKHGLRERLHHTLKHDYGLLSARTQMLDVIQQGLECCGAESLRDWQGAWWQQQQGAPAAALDLSVSAPLQYYMVPASCCSTQDPIECEVSRRVPAASGAAPGLHAAPCAPRALAALAAAARVPLAIAAAFLAAHAAALLLALALCLRARPDTRYKA